MTVVFAGATMLATISYTIVAAWTLREIQSGSADTHDLAIAARQQSEAIRPRLVIAQLTPQPLTAGGLPISEGKLHVWFQVPNYGPLVADNVALCEFDELRAPNNIAPLPYSNCKSGSAWNYGGSPVIPPITEINGMQAPGWGMDGSTTLTESDIAGLHSPNMLEAVFSVMATYDDASGRKHHAASCIIFTFQPKWGVGTEGSQTIGSWSSKTCPWKSDND